MAGVLISEGAVCMPSGFGEWLKRERARLRLTMIQVANQSRYSQAYISRLESGTANASPEAIQRIATAIGSDPRDALIAAFLSDEGETLRYVTDPDTAQLLELYEGLNPIGKDFARRSIRTAAEFLINDMESDKSIGKRADRDENPPRAED